LHPRAARRRRSPPAQAQGRRGHCPWVRPGRPAPDGPCACAPSPMVYQPRGLDASLPQPLRTCLAAGWERFKVSASMTIMCIMGSGRLWWITSVHGHEDGSGCVRRYRRIPFNRLRPGASYGFDLYTVRGGTMQLLAARGVPLNSERLGLSGTQGVQVFVHAADWEQACRETDSLRELAIERGLLRIRSIYGRISRALVGACPNTPPAALVEALENTQEALRTALGRDACAEAMAMLVMDHPQLVEHSLRVALIGSALVGRMAGTRVSRSASVAIAEGFIVHDIGMERVPQAITLKASPLDTFERSLVQMHPSWGCRSIKGFGLEDDEVRSIVACHHERPGGRGYPSGKAWDDLPLPVRVCAVADVFEALTSPRPYRDKLATFEALRQVYREFTQNGPDELFGALVELCSSFG